MDTLTRKANMMGSNYVMNGSDKSTRKVNLMKVSESKGVDNRLDKGKSTCIKNQDRMAIQNVMANQDGMFKDKLAHTHKGYGVNMDSLAEATKVIMNAKLEVKLGQLMKKIENFDKVMPIVQVRMGKFEIRDVLLDGGFNVNIIFFESLRNKLRLRRLQLVPFVVQMVD
jgi:hypothetical protein